VRTRAEQEAVGAVVHSETMGSERPGIAQTTPATAYTWIRGADVSQRICSVEGCGRSGRIRLGWCVTHYDRMRSYGSLLSRAPSLAERFWPKVEKSTGCWLWIGARNSDGYGSFRRNGKTDKAPRVAWELAHGPIPSRMHVLHHCDNPPCVKTEPDEQWPEGHLFLGTPAVNSADRDAKGRTRNPSVLTDEDVRLIRAEHAAGVSPNLTAARFGISKGYAINIAYGRRPVGRS